MNDGEELPEVISREDLYALVWSEPMSRLAIRFGYSDVGLAKACVRLMVPVPGRGYWAKKEVGRAPKATRLPTLPASARGDKRELSVRRREPRKAADPAREPFEAISVVVPEILTDPHSLVAKTVKAYRGGRSGYDGFLQPKTRDCLALAVTMARIDRAMCIYDAVIKAIEARGDTVEVQKYKRDGYEQPLYRTVVLIDGELVEIELSEVKKRVEVQRAPTDLLSSRYESLPSGRLAFAIRSEFGGRHSRWSDDAKHTLESQLGKFVHALDLTAVDLKEQRRRGEEYERERLEAQRREVEESQRRRLEAGRIRALEAEVDRMHSARWAREYFEAARTNVAAHPETNTDEMQRWLKWVEGYASRVDPFLPHVIVPKDPKPWE